MSTIKVKRLSSTRCVNVTYHDAERPEPRYVVKHTGKNAASLHNLNLRAFYIKSVEVYTLKSIIVFSLNLGLAP